MKTVIQANMFVLSSLVVILIGGICVALAQPAGGIKLNSNAFTFAEELIRQGHFNADHKGEWSEHRPSADEENNFIHLHGFSAYAKWHLGIDDRFPENSKRRYRFPYGDFKSVHRCGLLAVQARARQYGYADIGKAAAELERAMNVQAEDRNGLFIFANSSPFYWCKSLALKLPTR
jgi:hypothetical protein